MDYELRNAVEVRQEMENKWLNMEGEMTEYEIEKFNRHQKLLGEDIADAAARGKHKTFDTIEYRFYRKMCEHLRTLGYTVCPDFFEHRKLINFFKGREQWDFDLKTYDGNIVYTIKW